MLMSGKMEENGFQDVLLHQAVQADDMPCGY